MKKPSAHSSALILRKHFLTGLAVGAPIILTLWLMSTVIVTVDDWVLRFIPRKTMPADSMWRDIPGLGVIIFLFSTVALGLLAKGLIGRSIIRLGEYIVSRVPVLRGVYGWIKQIVETVLGQDGPKFTRACLIEYPRKGIWAVAFVSTDAKGEVAEISGEGEDVVSVFLPTTPNPTSGFLLFLPKSEVRLLDMGIDAAAKLVVSAGLVYPPELKADPKG
jgi:uncharacterized membrane protein